MHFIFILLLLISTNCFANQRVFYYDNNYIIDDTCTMTKVEVKEKYGLSSVQVIEIDETKEAAKAVNGTLIKYDYKKQNADLKREAEEAKRTELKQALNITDAQLDTLISLSR